VKASASRLRAAGSKLDADQRFAAVAAGALLATMFLPWYEKSVLIRPSGQFAKDAISAFGAVSFVEAAIFLVSAGVLALLLARAEGGRFHLPGGDGTVILGAGLWAAALIFYRVFDRPDISGEGAGASVGIQWGFFVAFVAAGALAFAGQRMRAAGRPEPAPGPPRPGRHRRQDAAIEDEALDEWTDARTTVLPPVARTREDASADDPAAEAPATQARTTSGPRPPDRAVRREDAALTVDDPPEPPRRRDR
jgi:hypothetical protein